MLLPEVLKGQEHLQSFKFIFSLLLSRSSIWQLDVLAREFLFLDLFRQKLMLMKGSFITQWLCALVMYVSLVVFFIWSQPQCILRFSKILVALVAEVFCTLMRTHQTKHMGAPALHLHVHKLADTKLHKAGAESRQSRERGVGLRTSLLSEKRGPCIHLLQDSISFQRTYLCQVFFFLPESTHQQTGNRQKVSELKRSMQPKSKSLSQSSKERKL